LTNNELILKSIGEDLINLSTEELSKLIDLKNQEISEIKEKSNIFLKSLSPAHK